ncbi:unnamed protein product [Closterium sp. NIES-54]
MRALYDAVVSRYSSPATAALGRLLLPYLFPKLSAFATVEDLVSHLRASDARCRAAIPAEFLDKNQPPMFITLYFIVTRLPDSLRSVRDHFLSLDPTSLIVDLLEQHLLAAETSAIAVASAAATDISVSEDVGAASASAKRHNGKGKGGKGGGGGSGGGGGGSGSGGGGSSGGGSGGGTGGGSGGSGGGGGGSGESGGGGGSGIGGGGTGAQHVGSRGGQHKQQQRRSETQSPLQLREWFLRGASKGSCPYVIRTGDRAGQACGRLHTQHRSFSRIDDDWGAEFGDDVERPHWADLLSAEGDCYLYVPPTPGIAPAALGASESGTLPGTAPAQALHTFTLDSGAFACFFRDSTTLTPLSTLVPVRLADPYGGPVVARSSTVLPCPAVPSGSLSSLHLPSFSANLVSTAALRDAMVTTTTPGGQCVTICTCTRTGSHLATFSQVATSYSCRLLSHQTLLWHHRLGHPSLPRLHGMHSRLLVSGLPRSLPPLPPLPTRPCLPCVEGRQRAAPQSSSFPPMTAPLQTLHMDVWGPARVNGQSRERYFLLVVDDYMRYTTVFPLRSKGQDLPVLHLHSDRGGEFSSNLLRDFCRGEGILQSFTLSDSPQQNGIAERRIGLVMEVARTSMIYAAAPHIFRPFEVRYAAHQLNLWTRVSLSETSPTLRWTGKVGDASVFRVWGSRAFVHDTSENKLSPCDIPCDVTFDESIPFYRLFPYLSAPPPPPPLFLAPCPPPVDPLPPQGPAPSNVSVVDPLPDPAPVQSHDTLRTTLAALGFAPATADPSLFLRTDTSLPLFFVIAYVDNLVFATADTEALTLVKSELQKRHTCTDLGELRSYLGLQITRDRAGRTITLTQSHMVHQVLRRFGFQFSSPQPTPLSTSHSLSAPPSDESVELSGPCPKLVGCNMYLMTCTRPDLAYPLNLLARYVAPGRHRKVH